MEFCVVCGNDTSDIDNRLCDECQAINDEHEDWHNKIMEYEREKKKIQNIGLSPQEYEKRIKEICYRLGI